MQFAISADHPSLPGHFPEHPVVPGVVILSYVFEALSDHIGQHQIVGIHRLKFLQPVLPEQRLRVEIGTLQAERLPFKCWLGERLVIEGQATLTVPK